MEIQPQFPNIVRLYDAFQDNRDPSGVKIPLSRGGQRFFLAPAESKTIFFSFEKKEIQVDLVFQKVSLFFEGRKGPQAITQIFFDVKVDFSERVRATQEVFNNLFKQLKEGGKLWFFLNYFHDHEKEVLLTEDSKEDLKKVEVKELSQFVKERSQMCKNKENLECYKCSILNHDFLYNNSLGTPFMWLKEDQKIEGELIFSLQEGHQFVRVLLVNEKHLDEVTKTVEEALKEEGVTFLIDASALVSE